jgi:hypothetical protein
VTNEAAAVSKVQHHGDKQKKTTDKQTKNQTHWYAKSQNSKESKIQF